MKDFRKASGESLYMIKCVSRPYKIRYTYVGGFTRDAAAAPLDTSMDDNALQADHIIRGISMLYDKRKSLTQ